MRGSTWVATWVNLCGLACSAAPVGQGDAGSGPEGGGIVVSAGGSGDSVEPESEVSGAPGGSDHDNSESAEAESGDPTRGDAESTTIATSSSTNDSTSMAITTFNLRLDVSSQVDTIFPITDGTGDAGCQKVDFVFVVDSSPSMGDEQEHLIQSFPGFIDAIQTNLNLDDFHLMVVDAGALPRATGCDGTLGAGQLSDGEGTVCGVAGSSRFASRDQAELIDVFTCMASRGIEGARDEQTIDALLASIGPLAAPGACNEGFLRDDAILVITIITDEEDDPGDLPGLGGIGGQGECGAVDDDANSVGDPPEWFDAVMALKGGDPSAVVVLGLIGDCDIGDCPPFSFGGGSVSGAEPAPRIREFVQSFEHGTTGPVCADDYAPFFAEAVSVIESACESFQPEG